MQRIKVKRTADDWEMEGYLKEDRDVKFLVLNLPYKRVEFHFPKPEYYYEKLNKEES